MNNQWLLIDTETTGVRNTDRVVEVAWNLIDEQFNLLDQGYSLINPMMPIPAGASAVHGITNRDVDEAPTIEQYFGDVLGNKLGSMDFIFTAHQSTFDYRYVSPYIPETTPQMCTLRLARKIWPNLESHKLGALVYELGLEVDKDRFHSADGDMAVLSGLLKKMVEATDHSLYELFEYANAPIEHLAMPFGKHRGVPLKDVPGSYVRWFLNEAANPDPDLVHAFKQLGFR